MEKIFCKICGKECSSGKLLGLHLRLEHDLSTKEYYDKCLKKPNEEKCEICGKPCNYINITKGYSRCCGGSCANVLKAKENKEEVSYTCKICNQTFTNSNGNLFLSKILQSHFRNVHNLELQDYYDKYEKKPNEGICETCGNPTRFRSFQTGYARYCCNKCQPNETRGFYQNIKKEKEHKSLLEKVHELQERIKNFYKSMVDDKTDYDPEKPIEPQCPVIAKAYGLIKNPTNESDKFYTEVDTCCYDLPCKHEDCDMKPIPKKDVENLTSPKQVEWL